MIGIEQTSVLVAEYVGIESALGDSFESWSNASNDARVVVLSRTNAKIHRRRCETFEMVAPDLAPIDVVPSWSCLNPGKLVEMADAARGGDDVAASTAIFEVLEAATRCYSEHRRRCVPLADAAMISVLDATLEQNHRELDARPLSVGCEAVVRQ